MIFLFLHYLVLNIKKYNIITIDYTVMFYIMLYIIRERVFTILLGNRRTTYNQLNGYLVYK